MSLRTALIRTSLPLAAAAAVSKLASGRGHGGNGDRHGAVATSPQPPQPPEPNRKGSLLKAAFRVGLALVELRSAAKKKR